MSIASAESPAASPRRPWPLLLAWSALTALGGALLYGLFQGLTGLEPSLAGVAVGLAVGNAVFVASGRRGGRRFQLLAAFLAFLAFDLTYVPGMAEVAFKGGLSPASLAFFLFITAVSPAIDAQNGFLGTFMVFAGMCLAWTLAGARKST